MIKSSTKITFQNGATAGKSTILLAIGDHVDQSKIIVITEETPFHPRDYIWPDQPGDRGIIRIGEVVLNVVDCSMAAMHKQNKEILLEQELSKQNISRNDQNYFFLVAHVVSIDQSVNIDIFSDQIAILEVDQAYRRALSSAHTAAHFAALALNRVTTKFWNKPYNRLDALGKPNLDASAIVESRVTEFGSTDTYHLGSNLRKKGFDKNRFFSVISEISQEISSQIQSWLKASQELKITMSPEIAYLHDRREWICVLPDGVATIPCGGTHVATITSREQISITLEKTGDEDFVIHSSLK